MNLSRKGFTLVEIMVVVAIIAVVAGIIMPNVLRSREKAQENTCLANIRQLQGALDTATLLENVIIADRNSDAIGEITTDYLRRMPVCPKDPDYPSGMGTYYTTDEDGVVHCEDHAPGEENGGEGS